MRTSLITENSMTSVVLQVNTCIKIINQTKYYTLQLLFRIHQKSIIQKGQSKSRETWAELHEWREEAARWRWEKKTRLRSQIRVAIVTDSEPTPPPWPLWVNQRGQFTQSAVWSGRLLDCATGFFFRVSLGSNSVNSETLRGSSHFAANPLFKTNP